MATTLGDQCCVCLSGLLHPRVLPVQASPMAPHKHHGVIFHWVLHTVCICLRCSPRGLAVPTLFMWLTRLDPNFFQKHPISEATTTPRSSRAQLTGSAHGLHFTWHSRERGIKQSSCRVIVYPGSPLLTWLYLSPKAGQDYLLTASWWDLNLLSDLVISAVWCDTWISFLQSMSMPYT